MTSTKTVNSEFDAAMADIGVEYECGCAERQKRLESLVVALGQIARIGHAATGLVEAREALDKCVAIARKAIIR